MKDHTLDKNPRWKGGISKEIKYCIKCNIEVGYRSKYCRKCFQSTIKGRKSSEETKEKQRQGMLNRDNPTCSPEVREKLTLKALLRHGHTDRSIPAFNVLYKSYKDSAKFRGYSFELTKEDFRNLTTKNCHYCNEIPSQRRRTGRKTSTAPSFYIYNGIDRIINNIGYTLQNCVPCCPMCNKMKRALSVEEFIGHAVKIRNHLENKKCVF